MFLGPNWFLPPSGVPGLPIGLPAETTVALAFLWAAMWVFSSAGIAWEALHGGPQRPIGKSQGKSVRRTRRGGRAHPALYPA